MASTMGKGSETSDLQSFFPNIEQRLITDPNNTRVHYHCQRSREAKSIFKQIQNNKRPDVPMQLGRTDCGTLNLCMQYTGTTQKHHDKAHNQRRDLAPDNELIDKYPTGFTEFVKTIDFTKVQ